MPSIPTDPLERCLEYKLGFDDVEDLQAKNLVITHDERKQMDLQDAQAFAQALIDQGPCEIEYLFLTGNTFGDEGLAAIAKAMEDGALPMHVRRFYRRFYLRPSYVAGRLTSRRGLHALASHARLGARMVRAVLDA